MKIVTTPSFRAFRPFFATTFVVVFAGLLLFGCQNHQTKPLFTTFSMPEHELITSLNSLNQDTLLVGTDQGNIYYYSPKTDDGPVDTLRVSNHRPVYVAYPSDLGLFVGVSNEGLKLFSSYGKSDRKPKHQYLLQLKGDTCTTEYAVYKVLKFGDTLFCATSNGLYWLNLSNLKDTILKSLYPNRKLPDCKIERLYLEGDSLKVYYNDSILSFNISGKFNTQHTSRPIPSDSREEMVSIKNITYKFKQYDTKFYAYDTLTINPHNFVFVTSMKNNDKIIAIADDDGITKDVYVGKKGGKLRWNRTWTKCLRNVPGQITDFIFFPNKSCLILTSEEVAYKGDKRGVQRLEFPSDTTSEEIEYELVKPGVLRGKDSLKPKDQPNRVKSVYYSENFKKLYVALGAGYAYYKLISEDPIWDSCCFVDYKDSAKSYAFRCFAEWDKKLCCGTIDDGFLYLDEKNNLIGTLPYQDIRYFKYVNKPSPFFVLTSDSLYVLDSLGNKKHKSAQENRYVQRLYESGNGVFGISYGHIYIHYLNDKNEENVSQLRCFPLDPTCGHVNPYAIFYDSDNNKLYVGTNKGLFFSVNGDLNNLTPVDIRDFWRTFNPVPFVLASVIVLLLILGYLLYRFMKQRHINTTTELKNTTKEKTELEYQFKTMEEDKRGLEGRIKTMEEDKRGLEDRIKNMEEDKKGLEGQLKTMEEDKRGLESQFKTMEEDKRELEGQLKTMEEDKRGLESQFKTMEENKRGLEGRIKTIEEDKRGLESQFKTMEEDKRRLEGQLKTMEEDKRGLEDRIKNMEEDKKGLEGQFKTMEEDKRGLESRIKTMEEDKRGLEGQLKTMEEDKRGLEGRIKNMEEDKRGLEDRIKNMEEDKKGLEGQLKTMEEDKRGLESQFKTMEEDKRELEGQLKTMEEDKRGLEGQLKTIEDVKTGVENKLREVILNRYQKLYSNNLPDKDDEKSEDWVIQAASQYKDRYRDLVVEVEKSTFTKDNSIEKMRESVNRSMFEYAFAAELYILRMDLKKKNLNDEETVKDIYPKIKDLSDNYMEKIVSYTGDNSKKKDVHLHLLIIALLSEGKKTDKHNKYNYINNDNFLNKYIQQTEYVKLMTLQNDDYKKPTGLRYEIRFGISSEEPTLFRCREPENTTISELFNKIVKTLKDEDKIGEYTGKEIELKTLKDNLNAYVSKMPKKDKEWKKIIDKIVILREKKQKSEQENGFVFSGVIPKDIRIGLLKDGIRLDITNSNLAVLDLEDPLKELFNKVTCNRIRDNIKQLKALIEIKGEDILKDESFYKQIKDLYSSIKLMFKPESGGKVKDMERAMLLWTWILVVDKQYYNKEFLQKFLQKMQDKSNEGEGMDETELERWVNILNRYNNPSSIIKPKEQFAELFKEEDWKNARLLILKLFGINQQR